MARRSSGPGDASTSSSGNAANGGVLDNGRFSPTEAQRIRGAAIDDDTRWHVVEGERDGTGGHMADSPPNSRPNHTRFGPEWTWPMVKRAAQHVQATGRIVPTRSKTLARIVGVSRGQQVTVRTHLDRGEWRVHSIFPTE